MKTNTDICADLRFLAYKLPKADAEIVTQAADAFERLEERYKSIREKAVRYGPVKGFVICKCEECGKQKAFCSRFPISDFLCECGHHTYLANIRNVYAKCKCGRNSKYSTNVDDERLSVNCIACGAPVDTEMACNGDYLTISEDDYALDKR